MFQKQGSPRTAALVRQGTRRGGVRGRGGRGAAGRRGGLSLRYTHCIYASSRSRDALPAAA
ncbi:hypothetical protein E2C01_100836 [Portunus trituberculatus]|uniref:Uncharacterized protein n=1 Tax=Portunus trituberculatus TaxID=210409 RepID=A0A5B7KIX8_PORTR|nr:hypothetical protein [Portunus trituberculatus]